jgi:hypothetical protein
LFHQPSELTATPTPPPPSIPRSPAVTSHSSTSLYPQPTLPSIHSSRHGSGFIPSHHTSPAFANRGSSPSKSVSSTTSWNPFITQYTPAASDLEFIPETNVEAEFFPRRASLDKDNSDMKSLWTLVEEQKREDQLLRAELGWGSQSGVSASQFSQQQQQQQRCQSREVVNDRLSQCDEHNQSRIQRDESSQDDRDRQLHELQRSSRKDVSMYKEIRLHNPLQEITMAVQQEHQSTEEYQSANSGVENRKDINNSNVQDTPSKCTEIENLKTAVHEHRRPLIDTSVKAIEEEEDDEGIPWF